MATITSAQSGNWNSSSTWAGGSIPSTNDKAIIAAGHTVTYNLASSTIAGMDIRGTLEFSPSASATLQSSKNIVVLGNGLFRMKPNNVSVVHLVRWIGIVENNVVGGGHDVLETDIGLWVMENGRVDFEGTYRKPWTRTTTGVNAGATSMTLQDITGWQIGDEFFIVPTDTPPFYTQDFNDSTGELIDSYFPKFERRVITNISGNTIFWSGGLSYNHATVSSTVTVPNLGTSSRVWNPEVANLTRNVKLEGTKDPGVSVYTFRRAHFFIRSTVPQSIKNIACRYLGPRKGVRPNFISGRYGIHFHHCHDGSFNSIVEGCVVFDHGNRAFVPHQSNGVIMRNCVAFNTMEEAFWWDFQENSHYTTWDDNLFAAVRLNGVSQNRSGMLLQMGDGNIARRNVGVFAGNCYDWMADSEGLWIFEDNMAHSSRGGITVWQNTGLNHTIIRFDSYNCTDYCVSHGAYGNSYIYRGGHHYNSPFFMQATSGNANGVVAERLFIDAGGRPECANVVDSPIVSNPLETNKFIQCAFTGYTAAPVTLLTRMEDSNPEKTYKTVDIILCEWTGGGNGYRMLEQGGQYNLKNGSRVRVQKADGTAYQTEKVNGSLIFSNIVKFAPSLYGTGSGLWGKYYNGINRDSLAFEREDSMIMFQQWGVEKKYSLFGVHHYITDGSGNFSCVPFSIQWTGKIQPQFSEPYRFSFWGASAYRLWVNGVLLIDSWTKKSEDNIYVDAPNTINLVAGQKYDIRIDQFSNGCGPRGIILFWNSPSLNHRTNVPMDQMYVSDEVSTSTTSTSTLPPPTTSSTTTSTTSYSGPSTTTTSTSSTTTTTTTRYLCVDPTNLNYTYINSFNPSMVGDLKAWYVSTAGVVLNSGVVETWQDQSGNNNHMVSDSTPSRRPGMSTGMNGLPSLVFNGSSNFLSAPAMSDTDGYTIIAIGTLPVGRGADSNGGWSMLLPDAVSAGGNGRTTVVFTGNGTAAYQGTFANTLSTGRISTYVIKNDPIVSGSSIRTYVNGVLGDNVNVNNHILRSSTIGFMIGRMDIKYMPGYIQELLIFNRVLTTGELNALHGFYLNKYNL